jgi:hypothetical protein
MRKCLNLISLITPQRNIYYAAKRSLHIMKTDKYSLSPPSLEELAEKLKPALEKNYANSSITVETCPDLRKSPFGLATEGLSGDERIADVGGQPNLFPSPRLECKYSLPELAQAMEMSSERGSLIGAGAGPFHVLGTNSELAPNLSWESGFDRINNQTHFAKINKPDGSVSVQKCPSTDCALMINLFGSIGQPGPVLKITARTRTGSYKSFSECIRHALNAAYGEYKPVSLGGAFLIKSGRSHYHVMPDFSTIRVGEAAERMAYIPRFRRSHRVPVGSALCGSWKVDGLTHGAYALFQC